MIYEHRIFWGGHIKDFSPCMFPVAFWGFINLISKQLLVLTKITIASHCYVISSYVN